MFNLTPGDERYPQKSDAELRISNSIVRYRDRYYWCSTNNSASDATVSLYRPENGQDAITVNANHPDLDVRSPELGWVFTDSGVGMFIARAPFRKQKQGVAADNLVFFYADPQKNSKTGGRLTNAHVYSESFFAMIERQPQPFSIALEAAKGKCKSCCGVPLSKIHALIWNNNKQLEVYRRLTPIGLVDIDNGTVAVYPQYHNSLNVLALTNLGVPISS